MNRIVSILLMILVARGSFGQMAKVGYTAMTVSDLEARDPVPYERVEVIHGATNCLWDEPRLFIHDPFSSATPIRGYVTTNHAMSGRYVSSDRWSSDHNLKNFLAVGDGVVDDTPAFEAAPLVVTSGKKLEIPWGVYNVTRELPIPQDYVTYYGHGYGSDIRVAHNGHAFAHYGVLSGQPRRYGVQFKDIRFTVAAGFFPSNALHLGDVSYSLFERVFVTGGAAPGFASAVYTWGNYSIPDSIFGGNWGDKFVDCEFYNRPGTNWVFYGSGGPGPTGGPNDLKLIDNYFGGGLGGARTNGAVGAIFLENCNSVRVSGNDIEQWSTNAIYIGTNATEIIIEKNRFEHQGGLLDVRSTLQVGSNSVVTFRDNMTRDQGGVLQKFRTDSFPGTIMDTSVPINQWYSQNVIFGIEPSFNSANYEPLAAFTKLSLMTRHATYTNALVIGNFDGVENPRLILMNEGTNRTVISSGSSINPIPLYLVGSDTYAKFTISGTSILGEPVPGGAFTVHGSVFGGREPKNSYAEGYTSMNYGSYMRTYYADDVIGYFAQIVDGFTNRRVELSVKYDRVQIRDGYTTGGGLIEIVSGNNVNLAIRDSQVDINTNSVIRLGSTVTFGGMPRKEWPASVVLSYDDLPTREPLDREIVFVMTDLGLRKFTGTTTLPAGGTNIAHVFASSHPAKWWVSDDINARPQNAKWWGMVGDGVTDNSTNFAAMLAHSRDIEIPRGRYALGTAPRITNAESVSIVSRDGSYQGGYHSTNLVTKAEFLYIGPPTNVFFDFQPGLTGGGIQMLRYGNLVENVSFNANGLADVAARIGYLGRGRFVGCRFNGGTGVNWLLNASQFCTFIDCSTSRNEDPAQTVVARYGMSLTNFCPVNMFIDCQWENSSEVGVHLAFNSKNNIFSGGAIEANLGDGLILESGADENTFTGTWFEANGGTNSIWVKSGAIQNSFTSLRSFEDNVLGTLRVAGSYNSFKNFGAHTIWIEPSGTRNKWENMIWVNALIDQTAGGEMFVDMINAPATIRTNTLSSPFVQYGEPFKLWNGTNLYERTRVSYDGIYFGDGSNPTTVGWTRFGSAISTTNPIISFPQGVNDSLYTAYVVGDAQPRVRIYPNQIQMGPGGTNAPDVFWKRNGASNWITEAKVWNFQQVSNEIAYATVLPGNAHLPFTIRGDGRLDFGSGAVARDASIERTGAGEITIRTNVIIDGMLNLGDEWRSQWTPFWLNVKDYGAIGDGAADDTAAIQAAIDSAGALYVVYFPPGNYRTTSRIDLNDGTRIRGDGWNTVIQADHNGHGFSYSGLPGGRGRAYYLHMQGLRLTTGSGKSPQNALNLIDVSDSVFIDINLTYGSGNGWLKGVYTYGNYDISDTNNVVAGGNWRNSFQKCRLYVRGGPGSWAFYGDGGPSSAGGPNDTVLFDCYFNGLGGSVDPSEGLVFARNCNRFTITHSGFEGYATNGVRIGTGSQSFTVAFNRFEEQVAGRNIIKADEWTPDGHLVLGNMMLLQGGPGSLTRIAPIDFPGNILDNSYGGAQQIMGPGLLVGAHPTHSSMTYLPLGTSKLIVGGNNSSDTNIIVIGSFDETNNPRATIVQLSTQSGTNRTNHLTFTSAASTGASEMELATGTKTNITMASYGTGVGWRPENGAELSIGGRVTAGRAQILSYNLGMPTNSFLIVGDGTSVDTGFVAMNYDGGTNSRVWMRVQDLRGNITVTGSAGGSFPLDIYSGVTLISTFDYAGLTLPFGLGMTLGGVYRTTWPTDRASHTGTQAWSTITGTPTTLSGYGITDPVWTSTNDGSGSGLDADLLDGQDGAYYLARGNHTGTQDWSTITGTPTTISGYGITDANFLPLAGGTVTGGLYLTGLPSDVSSVASYRFMVRDPGDNQIKPMTAAYALGFLDAAPSSHNHAASAITSGTMIADRLGTGTPSTNTFLQGNGTGNSAVWATIPSTPSPTNGIADAPADSVLYGRLNNSWTGVDIGLISGMSAFGSSWVQDVTSASDGRNTLELVGGSAVSIDSPAQHGVRVNSGGSTSTRHRLNLIAGAGISLSLTDDGGDDESDATIRLADGDYGDVSIGSSGAAMTVDNDAITYAKIQPPASTNMVLGFGAGTPGDVKELAVGTGLKTTTTDIQANIVPGTNVVITTNGTALQINVPPPAPLVFPGVPVAVAIGEVTDTNDDTTFRDVTPTVRSGSSLSLGAGTLVSGSVLKVEITGYMKVVGDGDPFGTGFGDNFEPDLRLIFDGTSDYTVTWKFNEPGSTGPYMGCTWTAEAVIVVASGGNPATVRQRSKATYEDGLGIQRPSTLVYGAGYAIQATGAASGDLDTTGANTVRIEYRANSSVMEEFRVTSLIIWHL